MATIWLLLRRTLVRSVILINIVQSSLQNKKGFNRLKPSSSVSQERFFSNPEFLEDLRELYRLRQVLEDEGVCEKLVKKPKLAEQRKEAIKKGRQSL